MPGGAFGWRNLNARALVVAAPDAARGKDTSAAPAYLIGLQAGWRLVRSV